MHETVAQFLSASQLAALLRAGEITSRQTFEAHFAQIEKQNPTYNAIVTLDETQALAQADQADQAIRDGKPCGVLHGVPITIKDTYRVTHRRAKRCVGECARFRCNLAERSGSTRSRGNLVERLELSHFVLDRAWTVALEGEVAGLCPLHRSFSTRRVACSAMTTKWGRADELRCTLGFREILRNQSRAPA